MIIDKALSKIFGTKHDRDMKALTPLVEEIGRLEPELVGPPARRPEGRGSERSGSGSNRS